MRNGNHHLFREITEQPEVWRSISSRVEQIQSLLHKAVGLSPHLLTVTGRGSSAHAAKLIGRFGEEILGVPSRFFPIEDSGGHDHRPSHASRLRLPKGIGVIVSQSGRSPDLLRCAEDLRDRTEFLIAITNSDSSPLAEIADAHLGIGASIESAVAATKTFSGSVVMGALAIAVLQDRLETTVEEIERLVNLAPVSLGLAADIPEALVDDILHTKRVLVVSTLANLAIAEEAALKLSENAGITAIALSASDAIHGPIAQVDNDVTVLGLVSAPGDSDALEDFFQRVHPMSSRVWQLDASGFYRPNELPHSPFTLPPIYSGLLELIPLQWLSGILALRSGRDPDSPRALIKETLTL